MTRPTNVSGYILRETGELFLVGVLAFLLCEWLGWPLWIVGITVVVKASSSVTVYGLFLRRPFRRPPRLGIETLLERQAVTLTALAPDGQIRIDNEIWTARSLTGERIPIDRRVRIVEVAGLVAWVEPVRDSA